MGDMAFKNDVADDKAPVGHSVWPHRAPCLAPRPALLATLVSSRGSGRPSISEPLDRCPFGPPIAALPYTYIKPSTPPLHHFLHSPIRIGTCDYVATVALRGSWSLGAGSNCWVQTLSIFFHNLRRRRMELNTFFTEDECGSDSHSTGRGRGRGKVGGRSQGSTLSGGSNLGRTTSGGRSAGGGRSITSGRGCGQGGMPPPTEGSSGHPKMKHGAVSRASESGSTAFGSLAKRPRKITSSDEKLSDLAQTRLRKEACDFFSKNSMQFLE
jgi:hypothetical protein